MTDEAARERWLALFRRQVKERLPLGDIYTKLDMLLALLDAAARPHDAEFVTRAMYDDLSGRYDRAQLDNVHISTKLGAAERRVAELAKNYNDCEERAGRLAAALAASEAKLGQAQVVINAALDDLEAGDEAGAHLILKHAALRPAAGEVR